MGEVIEFVKKENVEVSKDKAVEAAKLVLEAVDSINKTLYGFSKDEFNHLLNGLRNESKEEILNSKDYDNILKIIKLLPERYTSLRITQMKYVFKEKGVL